MPRPIDPDDEGLRTLGERTRRLALGLTVALIAMRPYWPSEDAATGTGLNWVLAMLVVAALAVISALLSQTLRFRWSWVDTAFLVMIGLVGLSSSGLPGFRNALHINWPGADDRRAAINLAWEWGGIAIAYFLVRNLPRTRGESAAIAGAIVASSVAVAAYGLYQVAVELPLVRKAFLQNPQAVMGRLGIVLGTPSEELFRHRVLDSKEPFAGDRGSMLSDWQSSPPDC
jgi:hypothetical protein